jgi:hypothetical protein
MHASHEKSPGTPKGGIDGKDTSPSARERRIILLRHDPVQHCSSEVLKRNGGQTNGPTAGKNVIPIRTDDVTRRGLETMVSTAPFVTV